MDQLLPEMVSYIFRFLSVADRKESALVCKKWYHASLDPYLQKSIVFKCQLQDRNYSAPRLFGRKLTHVTLGDENSSIVSEDQFFNILSNCTCLVHLDLSFCNSLFLSGQLLADEEERSLLRETLCTVKELKLSCLRHMTDVTFTRLVSVLENLTSICLASNNILFNNGGNSKISAFDSPAVFNFLSFLRFVSVRVEKLKKIDLSFTALNDQALEQLCTVPNLRLEELTLKGCIELTDKGMKCIAQNQSQLQILDISSCKSLANGKSFFRVLDKMSKLNTLKARKCPQIGQCDVSSLANLPSLHRVDLGEALNIFESDLIKGLCGSQQNLSVVELAYCPDITDRFVLALCESNPGLRHLDLTSCRKITDASLHTITRNLMCLQYLCLAYCHEISDLGLLGYISEKQNMPRHYFEHDHETCTCMRQKESRIFSRPTGILKQHQTDISRAQTQLESGEPLFKLSKLSLLKTLDLSSCPKITDLGVIQAIQFQELQTLLLEYLPKITDKGIMHLARCNPSLENISLRGCAEITDITVNSVFTHCPRLRTLNVAQNDKLTDTSLVTISRDSNRRLRNLDISFCGNISYKAAMNMEKQCPNLKYQYRPHIIF